MSEDKLIQVKSRIANVDSSRSVFNSMWWDAQVRRQKRAQVRKQLEGGQPWDANKLKEIGRGDVCNHNFRDAEAAAERAESPFWEMAHAVSNKAAFTIDEDYQDKERDEKSLADIFDMFLEDWGMDYILNYKQFSQEYIRFGVGYVMWRTKESPRFRFIKGNDVLFPKDTPILADEWELCDVVDEKPVGYFWKLIETEEKEAGSKARGWDTEMIRQILMRVGAGVLGNGVNSHRLNDWDYWQDEIKDNDLTVSNTWPSVYVVHELVRQQDGKISHKIFLRDGMFSLANNQATTDPSPEPSPAIGSRAEVDKDNIERTLDVEDAGDDDGAVEEYVFEDLNAGEEFGNVIRGVFGEVGNGHVHGVNGFAQKNYPHSVMINRIKCKLVDAINMSSSMNFQRAAEASDDTPPLESFGAINVFPAGLQELKYRPDTQNSLAILNLLELDAAENNALFREQSKQIEQTETATQAQILAGIQSQASQANAAWYLTQLGELYSECFNRLRDPGNKDIDAKRFRKRAEARKINPDILADSDIFVASGAAPSTANPVTREFLYAKIRQEARTTPGANVRWADELFFSNLLGPNSVKKLLPANPAETDAAIIREALLENLGIGQGAQLPVDRMDDHIVHISTHITPLEQIAQNFSQGKPGRPDQLLASQGVSQHIEAHLQFLSEDSVRQEEFKALNKRYNIVKQQLTQIMNQAITEAAAAAEEGAQ